MTIFKNIKKKNLSDPQILNIAMLVYIAMTILFPETWTVHVQGDSDHNRTLHMDVLKGTMSTSVENLE